MNRLKRFAALVICASLIGGGCSKMNFADKEKGYEVVDGENGTKKIKVTDEERGRAEKREDAYRKENYVSVQDYVGEGFTLEPDHGTDALAKKNKIGVEQAVKDFFIDKYKTEVKVHNIVGTTGAASVFVESIGNPHFYTLAIIPVDVQNDEVKFEEVWSLEGEVEMAIITGIFAMIYDKEFAILDNYLEDFVQKNSVTGQRVEAVANVGASKHATSYYRLNAPFKKFEEVFNEYIENPKRSAKEWQDFAKELNYAPEHLNISIELFMSEKDAQPDEALIDKIALDIGEMEGLPRAKYIIYLHDNFIDKKSGVGEKENTLKRGRPNLIIKE